MASEQQVPTQKLESQNGQAEGKEDQLASDLKEAKGFADKIFGKISSLSSPITSKGAPKIKEIGGSAKNLLGGGFIKKIAKVAGVALVIILLLLIALQIVERVRDMGMGEENGIVTTTPSISPGPYIPLNPSVYAEDELVLEIEDDLRVIDREMSTTGLPETTLTPPVLDFDINFKK